MIMRNSLIMAFLLPLILSCQWLDQNKQTSETNQISVSELLPDVSHAGAVRALAVTNDNRFLISAGNDNQMIIWYLKEQQAYRSIKTTGPVTRLLVSAGNDSLIAVKMNEQFFIYHLLDGRLLTSTPVFASGVITLTTMKNDLLVINSDGSAHRWNKKDTPALLPLNLPRSPTCFAINSAATRYAAAFGAMAQNFSLQSLAVSNEFSHREQTNSRNPKDEAVASLVYAKNDSVLISAADRSLYLWNLRANRLLKKMPLHLAEIICLTISPDGRYLASGGMDKTINIVDLHRYEHIYSLYGHFHNITALQFSADSDTLFCASEDNSITVWDMKSGKCCYRLGQAQSDAQEFWKINKIAVTKTQTFKVGSETYRPMKNGFDVLNLDLRLINASSADQVFYSSNLRLEDDKGQIIRSAGRLGHVALGENEYFKSRLRSGQEYGGTFVFLVESGQRQFNLYYEGLGPIKINL